MDLAFVDSYRRAATRDDLALAPGEAPLAGGTWLFSEPQPTTTGLVDLTTLGWAPWESTALAEGVGLRIAATCTVEQLLSAPWSPHLRGLARSCADAFVMSWKIQQTATIGGNLCLALPAGAMISLLAALDGTAVVWTPDGGERRERVVDLVTGPGSTTLAAGEVVRAVDVPATSLDATYAFRRTALTRMGRSGAVVIGRRDAAGLAVTITASTPRPVVVHDTDVSDVRWYADPHGPADWRAAVTAGLVAEVVEELS